MRTAVFPSCFVRSDVNNTIRYPNTARVYLKGFTGNADMPYDFFMSRYKEVNVLRERSSCDVFCVLRAKRRPDAGAGFWPCAVPHHTAPNHAYVRRSRARCSDRELRTNEEGFGGSSLVSWLLLRSVVCAGGIPCRKTVPLGGAAGKWICKASN